MIFRVPRPISAPPWWDGCAKKIEEALRDVSGRTSPIASVTADRALKPSDGTVLADATAGAITLALPPAASARGRIFTVKKVDASGNAVTLDGNDAETIDGAATLAITTQHQSKAIQSDGSGWFVL